MKLLRILCYILVGVHLLDVVFLVATGISQPLFTQGINSFLVAWFFYDMAQNAKEEIK